MKEQVSASVCDVNPYYKINNGSLPKLLPFSSNPPCSLHQYSPSNTGVRLPRWLSGKESACQCGRCRGAGSISGLGRSPGVGNGNPPQYSCLRNPMDRGGWWAIVHRVAKVLDITERLNNNKT